MNWFRILSVCFCPNWFRVIFGYLWLLLLLFCLFVNWLYIYVSFKLRLYVSDPVTCPLRLFVSELFAFLLSPCGSELVSCRINYSFRAAYLSFYAVCLRAAYISCSQIVSMQLTLKEKQALQKHIRQSNAFQLSE